MNREQELEYQEEYETRVLVFVTDFKNGKYIANMEGGFNPRKFIGTRKDYDKVIEFYNDHSNGKIIGTTTYTIEEYEEKYPTKKSICPFSEEALSKSEEADRKLRDEIREKLRQGKKIGRLERLFLKGKI